MLRLLTQSEVKDRAKRRGDKLQFVVTNITGDLEQTVLQILDELKYAGAFPKDYPCESIFTFDNEGHRNVLFVIKPSYRVDVLKLNLWRMRNLHYYNTVNLDYYVYWHMGVR